MQAPLGRPPRALAPPRVAELQLVTLVTRALVAGPCHQWATVNPGLLGSRGSCAGESLEPEHPRNGLW